MGNFLEAVCTEPRSAEAWLRLLGNHCRGLGLRHACIHAPAGYASSVLATQTLSGRSGLPFEQCRRSNPGREPAASRLTAAGPNREAFRAHFQLQQQPGAEAWLHAPPSPALDCMPLGRSARLWSACGCGSRWLWVTPLALCATEWGTATATMPGFPRVVATAQSATTACGCWSLPDCRQVGSTPTSKNWSSPTLPRRRRCS